jgi:hypothetical protein
MSLQRGSFRGRGRAGRESWIARRGGSGAAPPEAPPRPFCPTIDSIDIKALLIEEDCPEIVDVEYVASYNWLDAKSPVILVPGEQYPSSWQEKPTTFRVDCEVAINNH